jgi:predicted amidohydrolase
MKLIAAQISSAAGNLDKNLEKHLDIIHQAARLSADGIFFPELSLSGYRPSLAQVMAIEPDDERLEVIQKWSDHYGMFIAVGVPTKGKKGIEISMIAFQPGRARTTYSKQHLHADELPFFTSGSAQVLSWLQPFATSPCRPFTRLKQPKQGQRFILPAWPNPSGALPRLTVIIH